MRKIFLIFIFFQTIACSHSIHIVHVSDFNPYNKMSKGKVIQAGSKQFVILGFAFDTNYVDQAYRKLMHNCPQGQITGITSQFSTSHGFFSWTNKILMKGLCLPASRIRNRMVQVQKK